MSKEEQKESKESKGHGLEQEPRVCREQGDAGKEGSGEFQGLRLNFGCVEVLERRAGDGTKPCPGEHLGPSHCKNPFPLGDHFHSTILTSSAFFFFFFSLNYLPGFIFKPAEFT